MNTFLESVGIGALFGLAVTLILGTIHFCGSWSKFRERSESRWQIMLSWRAGLNARVTVLENQNNINP